MTQQAFDPYAPNQYAQVARKRSKAGVIVLAIVGLVLACSGGIAIGASMGSGPADSPSVAAGSAESTNTPAKPARKVEQTTPSIDDGVWTVGVDMPAGRYRTTAAVSSRCYWQISKTGGDGVSDIISNDLPGGGRPQVTLKVGQDFKTDNCGTWHKVK